MPGMGHIQIEKCPLKVGYMPTSSGIAGDGKKTGRLEKIFAISVSEELHQRELNTKRFISE